MLSPFEFFIDPEEFHKLLPHSELNWIPKCGHAAMWEHPKPFSEIVLRWLKDHNI